MQQSHDAVARRHGRRRFEGQACWLLVATLALQHPALAGGQTITAPPDQPASAQPQQAQGGAPAPAEAEPPPLKEAELEQLVAPIALYPDALLAQTLMASTYPLEIVQAARWAKENEKLKGKELEDAVAKQPWDPSVRSLASFPQVLTMMNDKLDWTQKLGDAFLAQESEVMAAVQKLRAKAKAEGNLKSNEKQKVKVEQGDTASTQVIVIEPADPQVVYVPSYNPSLVYGAWPYPAYPPYAWYPAGAAIATGVISFGIGMAAGAALWGGVGWGGWHGHHGGNVQINNVNNFNRANRTNVSNRNWSHNSAHRGGVQYRNNATAQRYGRGGGAAGAAGRQQYRGRSGAQAGTGARAQAAGRQPSGSRSSAFQGAGGSGRQARMDSSRGGASRGGGGFSRGGGGMRGGGGGRRR